MPGGGSIRPARHGPGNAANQSAADYWRHRGSAADKLSMRRCNIASVRTHRTKAPFSPSRNTGAPVRGPLARLEGGAAAKMGRRLASIGRSRVRSAAPRGRSRLQLRLRPALQITAPFRAADSPRGDLGLLSGPTARAAGFAACLSLAKHCASATLAISVSARLPEKPEGQSCACKCWLEEGRAPPQLARAILPPQPARKAAPHTSRCGGVMRTRGALPKSPHINSGCTDGKIWPRWCRSGVGMRHDDEAQCPDR